MAKVNLDRFLVLANALGPLVLALIPGGEKLAPQIPIITGAIAVAEQIPGATGPEKKAYVRAITQAGVQSANATGKVHLDPLEIDAIADKGIDAVIAAIHVVHMAGLPGTALPPLAPPAALPAQG